MQEAFNAHLSQVLEGFETEDAASSPPVTTEQPVKTTLEQALFSSPNIKEPYAKQLARAQGIKQRQRIDAAAACFPTKSDQVASMLLKQYNQYPDSLFWKDNREAGEPLVDAIMRTENLLREEAIPRAREEETKVYEGLLPQLGLVEEYKKNKQMDEWTPHRFDPKTLEKTPLRAEQITLPMLLAAQSHLGQATSLWHPGNSGYIFGVREGIHIISLETTLSYLRRACRVVEAVSEKGGIVLFVGTRRGQADIVVRAARRAKAYHIFTRWKPGSLSNGQQLLGRCRVKVVDSKDEKISKYDEILTADFPVLRPDLVVCINPMENEVLLRECAQYAIPTIGVIDTDANPTHVTYPIPANDDSLRCIQLLAGALGEAGKAGQEARLRNAHEGRLGYDTRHIAQKLKELEQDNQIPEEVKETYTYFDLKVADADTSPSLRAQPETSTPTQAEEATDVGFDNKDQEKKHEEDAKQDEAEAKEEGKKPGDEQLVSSPS